MNILYAHVESIHKNGFYVEWGVQGFGFGELTFSFDPYSKRIYIDTETLSKEFVKEIMNYIIENAVIKEY